MVRTLLGCFYAFGDHLLKTNEKFFLLGVEHATESGSQSLGCGLFGCQFREEVLSYERETRDRWFLL